MSVHVGEKNLLQSLSNKLPANCRRCVVDITIVFAILIIVLILSMSVIALAKVFLT